MNIVLRLEEELLAVAVLHAVPGPEVQAVEVPHTVPGPEVRAAEVPHTVPGPGAVLPDKLFVRVQVQVPARVSVLL